MSDEQVREIRMLLTQLEELTRPGWATPSKQSLQHLLDSLLDEIKQLVTDHLGESHLECDTCVELSAQLDVTKLQLEQIMDISKDEIESITQLIGE